MEESKYNATVVGKILLTPDIMTLRVDTDEPRDEFSSGSVHLAWSYMEGKGARPIHLMKQIQ